MGRRKNNVEVPKEPTTITAEEAAELEAKRIETEAAEKLAQTEEETTVDGTGAEDSESTDSNSDEEGTGDAEKAVKEETEHLARLEEERNKKVEIGNPLLDPKATLEDKVQWALKDASKVIQSLANSLVSYNDVMKPGAILNESKMVRKQYDLVNTFRSIINTKNYVEFKMKMDVLNVFMLYFKNESLSGVRMSRFDYLWSWSDEELTTLLYLAEVFSSLADFSTRAKNLKQIDFNRAFDIEKTIITEDAKSNFIRYYKV